MHLPLVHDLMALLHSVVFQGKILQPEESPTFVETWKEMEKLVETGAYERSANAYLTSLNGRHIGKVKSIGVSNFSEKTLDVLLPRATIIPAVNQVCAQFFHF